MQSTMKLGFFGDGFLSGLIQGLSHAAELPFLDMTSDGATSADVLKTWKNDAEDHLFCGFVFSFGAEDCLFGAHKRPQVGQLDRLKNTKALMMAARAKAPTLFISPFPVVGREQATPCIANTARQMTTIARVNKVDYINVFDGVVAHDTWQRTAISNDSKYPSKTGFDVASDLIMQSEVWQKWLLKI